MEQRLTGAFILSLVAGLWMLGSGGMVYGMHYTGGSWMWHQGMMGMGFGAGTGLWWPWFGFVAGVVVLVAAGMFAARPAQARMWGATIVVISVVNAFVGMGGLLAGTLGVIGGALALTGRPK